MDGDDKLNSDTPPEPIRGVVHETSRTLHVIPYTQSEKLAASLIEALEWPCSFGARLQQMGPHLGYVPYRLGHSKALDASISCLLQSYTLISRRQPRNDALELASYGNAIRSLRLELSSADPNETNSETLCAALIMAQYEVLKPSPTFSYVTLAGGVSAIIQACGAKRIQSDFEQAMFTAHYPGIIIQCLLHGYDCFLSEIEWMDVMRRSAPIDGPLVSNIWVSFVQLPGLLSRVRSLDSHSDTHYASVLRDAYALRKEIVKNADDVNRKLSHPGVHAICPAVYKGPLPAQPWTPVSQKDYITPNRAIKQPGFYHGAVILVNTVIQRILQAENPSLTIQSRQSVEYILSTMDFTLSNARPLGAMFMTFAGPMAYGICGPDERSFLLIKMNELFGQYWNQTETSMMIVFEAFTGGAVFKHSGTLGSAMKSRSGSPRSPK
ncbi:hypothetical protein LTR10_013499 [Elasticomyces elasticus]|uniref:Uncharacterized protein n=1 Tax=Exophiala sideris TaxID=1016849 RepID=A0ABR0JQS2_9EURO|nr:hypothetical protein LTR10_013499 [Elasticomyces elasticus]KAK5039635.1 hypothetical protein LTS07_000129 [Exophiala sideris]KAK5041187.1 hypothetical protein LTR13_002661 [Exophiala sideris]KAK5068012.1 hypothetical protein LTR69_000129 [Exophiala sideris]KAK5187314.1 hypothetical protein LTR44_000129 [Eurotiomycetes sp. CCFEE 6388]